MTTWSEAFTQHLDSLELSQLEALISLRRAKVRATVSQISYWRRGTRPRDRTRRQIATWSKGAVPADLPATHRESSTHLLDDSAIHAAHEEAG